MKKVNVIDLDKTLINFDSYRLFIKEILRSKYFLVVLLLLAARVLRFYNNSELKEKLILILRTLSDRNSKIEYISNVIINNIDVSVLKQVNDKSDKETLNILCSASPKDYVDLVAKKLKWISLASDYYENNFINMHGANKISYLQKFYPKSVYEYNFSISDSASDKKLLSLFKYSVLKR